MEKILEEIAERAKQRSIQSTPLAPPSAPPLSALAPEFDPSAMAALSAKAALNLWKPNVWLRSSGARLGSVVSDGKHFFIGTPETEFTIFATAPPQVDFLIVCYIDGRVAAKRVWCNSTIPSSQICVEIDGFYAQDSVFPFVFAPSVMTSGDNSDSSIVTPEAGKIRLVFFKIEGWKQRSRVEKEGKPPVDSVLEKSDQKFFNMPGLTVKAGKKLRRPVRPTGSASNFSELAEIIVYYDTEERLRLRGILPADDPVPSPSPAKHSRKRAKVSEFITMIDITGDEPVFKQIKKEPIAELEV